jgi:hypothetical protein
LSLEEGEAGIVRVGYALAFRVRDPDEGGTFEDCGALGGITLAVRQFLDLENAQELHRRNVGAAPAGVESGTSKAPGKAALLALEYRP